jgi:SM-20-related protein
MNSAEKNLVAAITGRGIDIVDNAVSAELYENLLNLVPAIGWRFGWNTPDNPTARYWHHEVGFGNKNNTECVADRVREHPISLFAAYQDWLLGLLPEKTKVLRFYLNAHTYGTDGWPHTDTERELETTAVLYLNPGWKPEWGGETVIFDGQGGISHASLPKPNRILTFPSNLLHAPRPLSRTFAALRVVLVVKLALDIP